MKSYYSAFVGHNTDYYLAQFDRLSHPNAGLSWNWSAFFFGGLWALYRKMYGMVTLWFFASMIVIVLPTTLVLPLVLCLYGGFALLANRLYFSHSNAKIAKALCANADE